MTSRPFAFYFVADTILSLRGYRFVQIDHLQLWTHIISDRRMERMKNRSFSFMALALVCLHINHFISCIRGKFSQNRRIILIFISRWYSKYDWNNRFDKNDIWVLQNEHSYLYRSWVSWFLRYRVKHSSLSLSYGTGCLSSLISIDPIYFSLFEPYVVYIYNFIYRTPYKLGQRYM